jgi:hypothetical protein
LLYPERSTFYLIEVITLAALCTKYFCALGDFKQADIHIEMIRQLDDEHPVIEILESYCFVRFLEKRIQEMSTELFKPRKKRKNAIKTTTIKKIRKVPTKATNT